MKRKPAIAGAKYETFDAIPAGAVHVGNDLYKGAHVRQYMSKLRTKVSGPSGEVLYFVCPKIKGTKVWRAFVAWRPEEGEHYDQFVDVGMLRLENTPPPPRKEHEPEPEPEPEQPEPDLTVCPGDPLKEEDTCGGELRFDPDIIGETCGGLMLRGWNVCQKCGRAWITKKATSYDGDWKLAGGGRSVETGNGRIRVDGCSDVDALMQRIVKLPDLELEVAQLRKYRDEQEALLKESETVPPLDPEAAPITPRGEPSPWHECKLVVNGTVLRDGDRILKINQPEAKDNGVYTIRLERP
jgi:hypothetical protein